MPQFASTSPIEILKQDGSAPSASTTVWYYYDGDSLVARVNTLEEVDLNALSSVKICTKSLDNGTVGSEGLCSFGDFDSNFFSLSSVGIGSPIYEVNSPIITFPPSSGAYLMNVQLTDDVGNTAVSDLISGGIAIVAVGINPKDFVLELNNETTTDWTAIDDFTNVSNLIFSAQDINGELGRLTLNGPLNLTDQATIDGLTSFGTNITVNGDTMRIDSSALAVFNGGATLRMNVGSSDRPGLVVKDNSGNIDGYVSNSASGDVVVASKTLGGFSWDEETMTLTFTTTGFSQFDTDNTAPTVSALGNGSSDYSSECGGECGQF